MSEVKRYKLLQDVRYDDGAFVIPAGQVVIREADYDVLRDERDRLRAALEVAGDDICSEFCGSGPCHKKCLAVKAALTPVEGGQDE